MNRDELEAKQILRDRITLTLIVAVALGLRFALLSNNPLNDHEANLALQALSIAKGQAAGLTGEPGYLSLTALLFFVFGASNFTARFWPAIFGIFAVLLPFLYRPRIGRKAALWIAVLIAMDPFLVGISKTAGGSMLALVGLLAGIGFVLRNKPVIGGICLGIALSGGPDIWTGFLILAGVGIALRFLGSDLRDRYELGLSKQDLLLIAGSGAISLILISTLFFTNLYGINAIGSSLASFFATWRATGTDVLFGKVVAWLIMQAPTLVLAIWGLVGGILRKNIKTQILGVWWVLSLILAVVSSESGVDHFYWVSIPILIFAAFKLQNLFEQRLIENRLVFLSEAILVVGLSVFFFLNLLALVNNGYLSPEETRNRIIGTLLPIILIVVLTILLSWGWSFSATRLGFFAGILLLFSLAVFSNAWKAGGLGNLPQNEMGNLRGYPIGSEPLTYTISDISSWNVGQDDRIDILIVGIEYPSLEWELRDFEELSKESSYNPNLSPSLLVTGIDQSISSSSSYRGQKFIWSEKPDLAAMKLVDWVKWAFFRTAPVEKTELILWARNDLFPGTPTP